MKATESHQAKWRLAAFALAAAIANGADDGAVRYDRWTVGAPVLTHGATDAFDGVAVKDPSIVFYGGVWHLFYTAKSSHPVPDGKRAFGITTGYVCAPTLEGLNAARRYDLKTVIGEAIIAPEVFFFAPQGKWYLIGHRLAPGSRRPEPVYLTNPDIGNVRGWSTARRLETGETGDGLRIDFWVICDDAKAHLFYSDQSGAVLRRECPLVAFPDGFARSRETVAVTVRGSDGRGRWRGFEAAHVYRVKKTGQYLMLLECGYEETGRLRLVDARRRFLVAWVADRLEGPWRRAEKGANEFFACAAALRAADGGRPAYTQVSHPELIRCGYDQRLEIEDLRITMLMQSLDGATVSDGYSYDALPWELVTIRNE